MHGPSEDHFSLVFCPPPWYSISEQVAPAVLVIGRNILEPTEMHGESKKGRREQALPGREALERSDAFPPDSMKVQDILPTRHGGGNIQTGSGTGPFI